MLSMLKKKYFVGKFLGLQVFYFSAGLVKKIGAPVIDFQNIPALPKYPLSPKMETTPKFPLPFRRQPNG